MDRFSHIRWYEKVDFGLIFLQLCFKLTGGISLLTIAINRRSNTSAESLYFYLLGASHIIPALIGVIGLVLLFFQKKSGWMLTGIIVITLVLNMLSGISFMHFSATLILAFGFALSIYSVALVFLFSPRAQSFAKPQTSTYIIVCIIGCLLASFHYLAPKLLSLLIRS